MSGISRRAYAKTRGVHERRVRTLIAEGVLAPAVTPDGTIDPALADRLLSDTLTKPKAGKAPVGLTTAKARRSRAQARMQQDELAELRRTHISPKVAHQLISKMNGMVAAHLRTLPAEAAPLVAGKPAAVTYRLMREAVNNKLGAIHDEFSAPMPGAESPTPELELDELTPVGLATLLASQAAEKLEIERSIAKGWLRSFDDFLTEDQERTSVSKSLLTAIPGRTSTQLETATLEEAVAIIGAEVELVINTLGVSPHAK